MVFPNNEFWQCPSYTYSTFVLGIIIGLIIWITFYMAGAEAAEKVGNFGGLFMIFWALRTLYLFAYPNIGCEATGYPGQHYADPFAKAV